MTNESIRSSIATLFISSWATRTKISLSNYSFDPPKGAAWVRLSTIMGSTTEGEVGISGVSIRSGSFIVGVFVPVNSGVVTAFGHADAVETITRRAITSAGVIFGEPYTVDMGADNYGYYHLQVITPFQTFVGE